MNFTFLMTVAEVGDDLQSAVDDPAIVMVNHQSTGDVPTVMYALQNKGNVLNNLMWVQDIMFRLTTFGWVSMVHGDFFIQQVLGDHNIESFQLLLVFLFPPSPSQSDHHHQKCW